MSAQAHQDFSFQIADVVLHLERATAAAATAAAAAAAATALTSRGSHRASPAGRARSGNPNPVPGAFGASRGSKADSRDAQAAAVAAFAQPTAGVVGEVVALRAGHLLVHWADGSESLVGPDKVGIARSTQMIQLIAFGAGYDVGALRAGASGG